MAKAELFVLLVAKDIILIRVENAVPNNLDASIKTDAARPVAFLSSSIVRPKHAKSTIVCSTTL